MTPPSPTTLMRTPSSHLLLVPGVENHRSRSRSRMITLGAAVLVITGVSFVAESFGFGCPHKMVPLVFQSAIKSATNDRLRHLGPISATQWS